MDRRDFLKAASVGGVAVTAGCSSETESEKSDGGDGTTADTTEERDGRSETETQGDGDQESEEPVENQVVYHVDSNGSNSGDGSPEEPLGTIQEALHRAEPGATIKVSSGEYMEAYSPGEPLRTVRAGEPGSPITITGPPDAILRPGIEIRHSHVHLTGLTVEALIDPENPNDPTSYFDHPILISPPADSNEYLRSIVCAPEGVGFSAYALIRVIRTEGVEIGPLRVTGIAGARWILPDKRNRHAGEVVYLGSPPTLVYRWHGPDVAYPWQGEIDETRDVHIHHIDNSGGHPHSRLVDAKLGTRDVTIEYCTDGGGSQNTEPYPASSIALRSYRATVRWCELSDGEGDGILVNPGGRYILDQVDEPAVSPDLIGSQLHLYGNSVSRFGSSDLMFETGHPDSDQQEFDPMTPNDLATFCENDLRRIFTRRINHSSPRQIEADPSAHCPTEIPEGNGTGHTGGEGSEAS